jgi:hypothetical protein
MSNEATGLVAAHTEVLQLLKMRVNEIKIRRKPQAEGTYFWVERGTRMEWTSALYKSPR